MATRRAFNILQESNENPQIGRAQLPGKNEPRATPKLALKDLTNNSSSRPILASKQQPGASSKKGLQQKPIASSVLQKKPSESGSQQPAVHQSSKRLPFSIFTPQDFEYSQGKKTCLREDLLEQMINCHGSVYRRELKPMKPLKVTVPELDVFQVPQKLAREQPISVPKPLSSKFLFDLPEVELPDLDFTFGLPE